jgi:putative transposase
VPNYRRAYVPGGSYFFTLVTADRAPLLCGETARACLRRAIHGARRRWPFQIAAVVLLPDHLHCIWTLPAGDSGFSRRWAWIKKEFTKGWLESGGSEREVSPSKQRDGRRGVWQRRFWEHSLRDETDFERHCDYIHYNPVKHGLVTCPREWPFSTFPRFVRVGDYPPEWGCASRPPPGFGGIENSAIE